jgi:hypothetical protein
MALKTSFSFASSVSVNSLMASHSSQGGCKNSEVISIAHERMTAFGERSIEIPQQKIR